ncbi:MAG: leucine-rich repeat domain-containing protein [Promethearchaeota archaeon]
MKLENEFRINDFITLKLEKGNTVIYVDGKLFLQCKKLVLNIPLRKMDDLNSIDEVAEKFESLIESEDQNLLPEEEFWGHCSNLQCWFENNYDTRFLHRSIAFPLLHKLSKIGDQLALKYFKEEIAKRFIEGNENIKDFLIGEGYLDYLDREEFYSLFADEEASVLKELELLIKEIIDINTCSEESPNFFYQKGHITSLYLENCNLRFLPKSIGKLQFLDSLHLNKNKLKELPDTIGDLKCLRYLIVEHNNLISLPKSIGELDSLEILKLRYNDISNIPEHIGNLKNINIIDLSQNKLSDLPDSIKSLKSLSSFHLSGNNFNSTPTCISILKENGVFVSL